jgi:PAS domain S-box-containing protein
VSETNQPQSVESPQDDIQQNFWHENRSFLQHERVFQRIVEQLTDGVALLNARGQVIVWNQACEQLTGVPRSRAFGHYLWETRQQMVDAFPHPYSDINIMRTVLERIITDGQAGQVENFEFSYRLSENNVRNLHVAVLPLQVRATRLIGMVMRDMTVYQKAQSQRQAHEHYLTLLHNITETALTAPTVSDMLHSLASCMVDLINADGCIVMLWDETARSIWKIAASPGISLAEITQLAGSCEEVLCATVIEQQAPIIADDLQDSPFADESFASLCSAGGLLAVPLLTGTQNLGAVIFLFGEPHTFMTNEVAECEHACRLAALTLSKALLLEEARQRAEEFETIARVTRSMRIARTRAEIPPVILDQVLEVFKLDGAAFMSHDPETCQIATELGRGQWAHWTDIRIPDEGNISAQVIASGQLFTSDDVLSEPSFAHPELINDLNHVVAIPLLIHDQARCLLWTGSKSPIPEKTVRILSTIADAVASAIHRQTLHEDLQTQLEALGVAQARLIQSEKLAAIGQLIAGVAHEVNNPLTSVLLRAQMLRQQPLPEETLRDLDTIIAEARRSAATVRGLLDFARQRPPERKLTQVNDVIKAALDLTAYELNSRHIRYETFLDANLPLTLADPHQLQQVLINLINNSWQAISAERERGHLMITTRQVMATTWGGSPMKPHRRAMIRIELADNGPGIPQDLLSRIFDPFFTTKPEGVGTGLGLAICHGIIHEHEGDIWAESEPGQGSTFFIELPIVVQSVKPGKLPVKQPGALPEIPSTSAGRILLIDDEASVIDILVRLLQRKGYQVDSAFNGTAGLAALFKARYDLILCDMRMPEMSGPEFYRQVAAKDPELAQRILFTTGDTVNVETRQFLDETKAPYLAKPFEMDDLMARVQQAIHV